MIGLHNSTFWYKFGWPWPSFKVTDVWEVKNLCTYFLAKFKLILKKLTFLSMLNLFCTISTQGREFYICDFVKYTFVIGLPSDTYESICFKLNRLLDTTEVYSIIPVWMILTSTQGHRYQGNVDLVLSTCLVKCFMTVWLITSVHLLCEICVTDYFCTSVVWDLSDWLLLYICCVRSVWLITSVRLLCEICVTDYFCTSVVWDLCDWLLLLREICVTDYFCTSVV